MLTLRKFKLLSRSISSLSKTAHLILPDTSKSTYNQTLLKEGRLQFFVTQKKWITTYVHIVNAA
jgi:hypothetical protein